MTQANDTDPTTKPSTGPQLVIEKLPFDSASGERYKWRLEEDGRLLVLGAGDFSTSWDASRDAARAALSLLHNLSMSYCRLGEEVSKVQEIARAKFEAAKKNGETGGTVQKFASAHAPREEESEEELSERARLDAEAEAPDDEGEVD